MKSKKCIYCGTEFKSSHSYKTICSNPICKKQYCFEKSYIKVICPQCKIEFTKRKSDPKIYCSKTCAQHSETVINKMKSSQEKTYMENYGVSHPMKTKEVVENFQKAMKNKYGVEHALQVPEMLERMRDSVKKTYDEGTPNKKIKRTKLERYGDENYRNNDKIIETNLIKYGVEHYSQSEEFKLKQYQNTYKKLLVSSLSKEILLSFDITSFNGIDNTYGFICKKCGYQFDRRIDNSRDILECPICYPALDKLKSTNLERYGSEFYIQTDEYKQKKYKLIFNNLLQNDKFSNIRPAFDLHEFNGVDDIKYEFICNLCDYMFVSYLDNGNIPRCPKCNKHIPSKYEYEIEDYLKELIPNIKIIKNDRIILNGKEIDIYLPEYNIGIEFNGIYWHTEISGKKNSKYHLNKTNTAEKNGISLLHIFENEWILKKDIVKSVIKMKLKLNNTFYGRNCIIKEVDSKTSNEFLNNNHLQGEDKSKIRIGLFNKKSNELISIMTFCKSRYNKNYDWEISRYAIKTDISILGGAQKLFSYFIKTYNPKSIITYSDRRYFNGGIYIQIGFEILEDTPPNFYYVNLTNRYHLMSRIQFQKYKQKEKLKIFDETLSAWMNMQLNGYDRIWDCGNKKFVWGKDGK